MASIGKVSAVFTASTSGLTSGVNRASRSMEQLQRSMRSVARSSAVLASIEVGKVFANIVGTVSSYTSGLVNLLRQQAILIDRQSKLAQAIGLADAELAAIGLAGELAGVSLEQVGNAANRLNVTLGRASQGNKAAQKAFADLGISFSDLAGLSPADQFAAIAEAISSLPTQAERAAAAVQIFGKSGAELLPLFDGGSAGIKAAAEQAERLGLALTNEQANSVEKMNDSLTLVSKAFSGIIQQVVAYLSPAVSAVATAFTNFIGTIGGANIGQAIGDAILSAARFLAGIADWLVANLSSVFQYLAKVSVNWAAIGDILTRAGQFLYGVFKAGETVFDTVLSVIGFAVNGLLNAAKQLRGAVGLDNTELDKLIAANDTIRFAASDLAAENAAASAEAFSNAFAANPPNLETAAGPFVTAIDEAIAQAKTDAAGVKTSVDGTAAAAAIKEAFTPQAVSGIDSRSTEGVREMFRLMRGNGAEQIQEEQRDLLAQIAANTSSAYAELAVADF